MSIAINSNFAFKSLVELSSLCIWKKTEEHEKIVKIFSHFSFAFLNLFYKLLTFLKLTSFHQYKLIQLEIFGNLLFCHLPCLYVMSLTEKNLIKPDHLKCLLITMANIVQRWKSTKWKGEIAGIHTPIKKCLSIFSQGYRDLVSKDRTKAALIY